MFSLLSHLYFYLISCLFLTSYWISCRGRQGGGWGGLEDVRQDIRIPARFSAVRLQSLLASYCIACMAVCSNSQGYCEPRRPSATCGTITVSHSFSLLTLCQIFLSCASQRCACPSILFSNDDMKYGALFSQSDMLQLGSEMSTACSAK